MLGCPSPCRQNLRISLKLWTRKSKPTKKTLCKWEICSQHPVPAGLPDAAIYILREEEKYFPWPGAQQIPNEIGFLATLVVPRYHDERRWLLHRHCYGTMTGHDANKVQDYCELIMISENKSGQKWKTKPSLYSVDKLPAAWHLNS